MRKCGARAQRAAAAAKQDQTRVASRRGALAARIELVNHLAAGRELAKARL
jgi:hypothetical protein